MKNRIIQSAKEGKAKIAIWAAGVLCVIGCATPGNAQTTIITFDTSKVISSRQDAVVNMATSQYWDGDHTELTPGTKGGIKQGTASVNSPTAYNISGEDKYIKTPEAGKRYEQFQIFDINGMDKNDVAVGILTNTLDRATRYDEKGDVETKIQVASGTMGDLVNTTTQKMKGMDLKVSVTAIRFKDKYFLIIGNNDYRYMDGKRLVGGQKVVDALLKGKPITEVTFFYELQAAGIVSKNATVSSFLKMTAAQKQRMLNAGRVAGNL